MKDKKVLFSTDQVDDAMYMSSELFIAESIKGSNALEFIHDRQYGEEKIILYKEGIIALHEFLTQWLLKVNGRVCVGVQKSKK